MAQARGTYKRRNAPHYICCQQQAAARRSSLSRSFIDDDGTPFSIMPPKKVRSSHKQVTPPSSAGHRRSSSSKGKFSRSLNQYSPSPENITTRQRLKFIPDSPPRPVVRSLHRMKEKPTCLVFGPHREILYQGFFFCSNCKLYEDAISSGGFSKKLNRDSRHFICQANHFYYVKSN
jgi:hypothetical protein